MNLSLWILAARPKTLIATLSPVTLGTVLAVQDHFFHPLILLFTLLSALGVQILTNLANDYFDFMKGADTEERKGPVRVTQSGLVKPEAMKRAVFLTFCFTAMVSTYLILEGGLGVALIAALSLILALAYTAGPCPLAYLGLGDLFVLLFFGPIATGGTYYLQTHALSLTSILAGIGPGLLSTAILTVNNLRDIEEDRKAEKHTLIARFGEKFGRWEYLLALLLAALLPCLWGKYLPALTLLPALPLIRAIFQKEGSALNPILGKTALLLGVYTCLYLI